MSNKEEGVANEEVPADIVDHLKMTARLSGLPEKRFFSSFTARHRREITYCLHASAPGLEIEVKVRGSGAMTAVVRMPCVVMDEGVVLNLGEPHSVSWVHSGEEAVLHSKLGHRHLENYPEASDVLDAFIGAMQLRCTAVGAGGYRQWKMAMQLLVNRIARERTQAIEVVATPPMPSEESHDAGTRRRNTHVIVHDITDPESPKNITGYEDAFAEIENAMAPEAVSLMLLPPGYIVRRPSREIFHAG